MNIKLLDYDEIYDRLVSGKPFDKKLNPYTESQLIRAIKIFEEEEEYEKCKFIKDYVDRLSHDSGFTIV